MSNSFVERSPPSLAQALSIPAQPRRVCSAEHEATIGEAHVQVTGKSVQTRFPLRLRFYPKSS